MVDYFNNETVKAQLKIPVEFRKDRWIACQMAGIHPFNYTLNETGSAWIYKALKNKGYKMLKYSGDTSAYVPTLGTQQWIHDMNWEVTEEWRPYFVQVSDTTKKVGGYVEVRGDFTLATVHGAGHMAAKFKSKQTYQVVFNFINGVPL